MSTDDRLYVRNMKISTMCEVRGHVGRLIQQLILSFALN